MKPRGCNFHFKQAILRYLKKLGLWAKYVQNPDFRKVIRWVLALPFVPHQKAREMFEKIKEKAAEFDILDDKLDRFFSYVNDTWFNDRTWLPETWSVFGRSV